MADPFRPTYRELDPAEKQRVDAIKDAALALYRLMNHPLDPKDGAVEVSRLRGGREFSLAKTNLEQAVMWAVKGVTG